MRGRAVARRYAWALVASVTDQEYPRINSELKAFLKAFQETELGNVLSSPFIAMEKKKNLVEEIAHRFNFHKKTRNFLVLLVERNRISLFPMMMEFFRQFWNSAHNIHEFTMITAVKPPQDVVEGIKKILSEKFGGEIILKTQVEPSIIGGLILKKGYTVYDGSIEKQLELIKRKIVEGE